MPQDPIRARTGSSVVSTLYAMAFIVGAVTLVGALFQISVIFSREGGPQAEQILLVVAAAMAGIAGALLLGAIGAILSHLQTQTQMMHRLVRAQEDCASCLARMSTAGGVPAASSSPAIPAETVSQAASWVDSQKLEQIFETLAEISDNLLLTPDQRQAKRSRQLDQTRRNLSETLDRLLAAGSIVEAQARLDQYGRLFPEDRDRVEQRQQQIDQARAAVEQAEYDQAAAKVRDLMATAEWDRAEQAVRDLVKRHPKSRRVRELADGVEQERGKFHQQQRRHVLAQIEQLSAERHWREAYRLAGELMARSADSPEAETLKGKLPTLKENADIEVRKELEEQFKELIRKHRYIEALALAQDVVAKYPGSPQAKALREQMPQLMSKAKLQMDQAGGGC